MYQRLAILILSIVTLSGCSSQAPPEPYGAVPSGRQLKWHEMKYYAFVHFSPNTFTDKEWGYGDESPEIFNPTALDCRQWARVASEAGMEGIVITAKHHDGFCLWPSQYTEHSVKNSPWKGGKGDVIRELREACDEYGLKLGIYLSPWDRNHSAYGTPEYIEYFRNQLRELLTNYGDVYEVWFDGANGGDGFYGGARETRRIDNRTYYDWANTRQIVRDLQPMAVMFSDAGPDIRWVGNERGYAAETNWCAMDASKLFPGVSGVNDLLQSGVEDGPDWIPAEVNTSIRPGWFYHKSEDSRVKSVNQLIDNWYHSVGMNGNFILNLPPDQRGLIHENDIVSLNSLKRYLDEAFSADYSDSAEAAASNVRSSSSKYGALMAIDDDPGTYWATDSDVLDASLEIRFAEEVEINAVLLQEYIALGQRVRSFSVEAKTSDVFREVASGTTIGNRRIVRFETARTKGLRIHFRAGACPLISNVEVYRVPEMIGQPKIVRDKDGMVRISSDSPDPVHYFTLDGTEPSPESRMYSEPFAFDQPGQIKVRGFVRNNTLGSETVTAEFDVPKSKWSIETTCTEGNWSPLSNVIDGDPDSFWASGRNGGELPCHVTADFGESLTLKGFTYLPRQDGRSQSNINRYRVAISGDGQNWTTMIRDAEFSNIANNPVLQKVLFSRPVEARWLRLTCLSSVESEDWINIAELGAITR
jgi:alpha-L-fucosidase